MNMEKCKYLLFCGTLALWMAGGFQQVYAATEPSSQAIQQQSNKVTGKVSDATGPIIGASVVEKGTANGTITDLDGNFSLNVKARATLVVSYVGYKSEEVKAGRGPLNITLKEDAKALDEVVVTALGIKRERKALGYGIDEVKGEALTKAKETNLINSMAGRVPGLVVSQTAGGPSGSTRVILRGSTEMTGNNQPLYVVDGVPLVIYGILMAQIIGDNLLAGFIDNHFLMVLAQTVISTLIILVTGEFLPKTIFKINPNLVLNVFAIPLIVCYVVLYPISKLASGLSCIFLRLFGMKVNKDASDRAFGKVDLDYFVQSSIDNAENEEELDTEVKIFQNALDFSNIKIRDCIVPRTEVVAVDLTTSLDELKSRFIESGISKIIVYDGNIDNVVGYIHSSEMFRAPKNWHENVKQVPIVPETMSANKLMKLFMQQKKTIAVVVDEFGGTSGIVSLEDLVEEIFGDIEDEHDNTSYISKQIDEREYVLSARLEIEKVNETYGLDLPESDDYLTVGGLILNQYQSFPKLHEVVRVGRYQFKIIKVTATKIELVRLKVLE